MRRDLSHKVILMKLNTMVDLRPIVTNIVATRGLKLLGNDSMNYTIRFSKTELKEKYKINDLSIVIPMFVNELATDIYNQVINTQLVSVHLDNYNITSSYVFEQIEHLYEIIFCNKNSNSFILRFKRFQ